VRGRGAAEQLGGWRDWLVHIFERYYSHRPGQAPGAHLGIGLWLVRQHVLLLGGAIAAVNREGGGLSVVVRLPVA